MGIRFRCHLCEFELHVKDFQGGKRGRCPECRGKFRIPDADAPHSLALEEEAAGTAMNPKPETAHIPSGRAADRNELAKGTAPSGDLPVAGQPSPAASGAALQQNSPSSDGTPEPGTSKAPDTQGPAAEQKGSNSPAEAASSHPWVTPRAIESAPGATWYVRPPTGGQFGPATSQILAQWLQEQRVGRDSLVWRDGWDDWANAALVFSDYFGADEAPVSNASQASQETGSAENGASAAAFVADRAHSAARPFEVDNSDSDAPSQTSLGERNRLARKQRRKRNYTIMLVVLTVLAITLVVALIVVLMAQNQSSATTQ